MRWHWTRSGMKGYYGYEIEATENTPAAIKEVMELSTKLDSIITKVIEDRIKLKESMKASKKVKPKSVKIAD